MQVVAPYQRSGAGKIASATRWAPALVHGMVSIGGPIERRAAVTLSFPLVSALFQAAPRSTGAQPKASFFRTEGARSRTRFGQQ
jgi:hypothetical protein